MDYTSAKACLIASHFRNFGMFDFAGFLRMCKMSDIACSMASISVYMGMGVTFGSSCRVSVSNSV